MKNSSYSLFVLLVALLFFQISFSNERITIQQGRFAAERICLDVEPLFPGWTSVRFDSVPTIYSNLNGDTVLYLYEIQIEGKKSGYCSIGAYDDLPVLIEATPAMPPHKNLKEVKKKLCEYLNIDENDINKYQLISPGDHFYYIRFSTKKGIYFIDLKSFEIVEENYISSLEAKINKFRKNKNKILHEKWNSIFQITFKKAMTGSSKKLTGVEPYLWYRGCAPTSLTMALNYKGKDSYFSNLRHSVSDFNWNGPHSELNPRHTAKQLVDHFADYFGFPQSGGDEEDYGVLAEDQPAAVISIANSHGYNFSSQLIVCFSANQLLYEINNDRPIKYGIPGHAQCGYGYAGDGYFIYYYNTWDTYEHAEFFVEEHDSWNMMTLVPNIKVPQQFSSIQDALNYIHSGESVLVTSGTYYQNDNLTVSNGKTLELNSAVTLKFASGKKLAINGTLTAVGTPSNPITIQSISGTWYGIEFTNASYNSMIQYCTIKNATVGVHMNNTHVYLGSNVIQNNTTGLLFNSGSDGVSNNNQIMYNSSCGIKCTSNSDPLLFSWNVICDNGYGYGGVYGDATSIFDLGRYSDQGYNSIYYNDQYEVQSGYPGTIYARYNWWGDPNPYPYVTSNVNWSYYLTSDPNALLAKAISKNPGPDAPIMKAAAATDTIGIAEVDYAYLIYRKEDYQTAASLFETIVHKYPGYFSGRRALAFLYKCNKHLNKASDNLTLLDNISTTYANEEIDAFAKNIAAGELIKQGDYQAAIAKSEAVTNSFAKTEYAKQALFNLGNTYWYFLEDEKTGEIYYRQLIKAYPEDDLSISALATLGEWKPDEPKPDQQPVAGNPTPAAFSLEQNFPNPFNPETTIRYYLAEASHVTIKIYNLLGAEVITLIDQSQLQGNHAIQWNGRDRFGNTVANGVYWLRLQAGEFVGQRKLVMVR